MEAKGIVGRSLGVLRYGLPIHEPLVFEFPTSKLRSMYNPTPYPLVCEYFDGGKRWGALNLPRFTIFSLIQVKCDKVKEYTPELAEKRGVIPRGSDY